MKDMKETTVWAIKTLAGVTVCEFANLPLLKRYLNEKKNTQHLSGFKVVSIVTTEEVLYVKLDNKAETDGGALQQVPTGALSHQAV